MIGKRQLQIDSKNFVQGLSTSAFVADGGIGTDSYNLNLLGQAGVLRASGPTTPSGDALGNQIIASAEDPRSSTTTTDSKFLIDDDGKLYTLSASTLNLRHTPSSSSGFTDGVTDAVSFQGALYVTKTSDIMRITVTSLTSYTVDESWWVTTKSQSSLTASNTAHPMLVFEGLLWIGDSEKLHSVDTSGTVSPSKLTLNTNDRITALGIDPGTGRMLIGISTNTSRDASATARFFVALYDGFSSKVVRRVPVDGLVSSFVSVGGITYVGMDNSVGYWNGSGVTFMRRLKNAGVNDSRLPYKSRMTKLQNTLLVVDGRDVLAFGDIANGKKVWYPIYRNQVNSNTIGFVVNVNNTTTDGTSATPLSPVIAVNELNSTNIRLFEPFDTANAGTAAYYSGKIYFERPVFIRRMRVFTTGITTTAGIGGIALIDETATSRTPTVSSFVVASGTQYVFDFDFSALKLQEMEAVLTIATQAFGIKRAIIYYDVAE